MSMTLDTDTMAYEHEPWERYLTDDETGYGADDSVEGYDDEASSTARRRRARQLELERRRRRGQASARDRRRPEAGSPHPTAKTTAAAIRHVELESKVQDDALRAGLAAQGKRQERAELATIASLVLKAGEDAFQGSVDLLQNPFAKAALTAAPLALLPSRKQGGGAGSYLSDPRVVGAAVVLGLAFLGDQNNKAGQAADVRIIAAAEVNVGDETTVVADVLDKKGNILGNKNVAFTVDRADLATIDANGRLLALKAGTIVISATADQVTRRVVMTIRDRVGHNGEL